MIYTETANTTELVISRPGSPPGMSSSKSSKASSLHSFNSDQDNDVAAGIGHFEEIGLEDDAIPRNSAQLANAQAHAKLIPNPYMSTFTADLRAASVKHVGSTIHNPSRDRDEDRDVGNARQRPRDVISLAKPRPMAPHLSTQFRDVNTQSLTLNVAHRPRPQVHRTLSARSASSVSINRRHRSPSPNIPSRSPSPRDTSGASLPRRSSWQSNGAMKPAADARKEYDEEDDDDDDIPDGLILDNVPLSPRPPSERSNSRSVSASTSPERRPKERVRSVGNGTPPVAADRGSLKSPTWKSDHSGDSYITSPLSPIKGRAKSWTAAISELNPEAKALTEKLEEHADELERRGLAQSTIARPAPKPRVKSAFAELPPLRRSNIMIDPLPISKEKEAVLSRTRPSWLPPKDPAEEKKHLKEYQKMMAISLEAEKKREAARREKEQNEAKAADELMRVWEDALKRWDVAIHEDQVRGVWWRGIPPKSRGAVWSRAIGNELGLTTTSFRAALARAAEVEERAKKGNATADDERRMTWFSEIRNDVEQRTWPELKIFQAGAPLHQNVVDVLRAYSMYRSDIGYLTGCHTIAALLLLNLGTPASTFIALANILNRPLPLSFFAGDPGAQSSVFQLVYQTLATKSPQLHRHLTEPAANLNVNALLSDVLTALFTRHLSIDDCARLWDVYVFENDGVLIDATAALLLEKEMALLGTQSAADLQRVLEDCSNHAQDDAFVARVRRVGKQ